MYHTTVYICCVFLLLALYASSVEAVSGTASFTFYNSYPACCPGPAYDPRASKEECEDYSGCKYQGYFAAWPNTKKSFDFVKGTNIIAFYDNSDPNGNNWRSKYAGQTVTLTKDWNGRTYRFQALIADTCGNNDCGGCCRKNAQRNGGYLVDIEYWTAKKIFGSTNAVDGTISFTTDNSSPSPSPTPSPSSSCVTAGKIYTDSWQNGWYLASGYSTGTIGSSEGARGSSAIKFQLTGVGGTQKIQLGGSTVNTWNKYSTISFYLRTSTGSSTNKLQFGITRNSDENASVIKTIPTVTTSWQKFSFSLSDIKAPRVYTNGGSALYFKWTQGGNSNIFFIDDIAFTGC